VDLQFYMGRASMNKFIRR